jgi:ABC-type dipeptide/oligopeptide/nickel transport system permease component
MITYIIRRLLYSVLVLIAASFLVFVFVAKGAGDPLGPIRVAPNVDQAGLDRIA